MFELITTYYSEKDDERKKELFQAIFNNCTNPLISNIRIICESGADEINQIDGKIDVISVNRRPTFKDLIDVANNLNSDIIKIIANTDIYFDESLTLASKITNDQVFCLTRWNQTMDGNIEFFPNFKSQDTWIFKSKLPTDIGEYFLGLPGCDNRFAFELTSKGFNVCNPSLSVRTIHLHNSNQRNYHKQLDRVPGLYAYVLPNKINDNSYQSKQLKYYYLLTRRKYYTARFNNNLEGVSVSLFERLTSYLQVTYYRIRLKLI